uniref:Uncharacterized protein n=1 Tax=Trypanosoma vivax (strain Y486) TaxID=1055687 RepID=G0TYF6_TRYVY|nr:hypothetical protein, conserved in T. vivax [Trypanosoma vivax Y486]
MTASGCCFLKVRGKSGLAPPDLCKSLLSLLKGRRLADSVFSEKQVPVASEGGMLLSEMKAIAVAERNVLPHAMRAFVERHGRPFFSFTHRPRAGVGIARADGFLRMEIGGPPSFFENKQARFTDLRSAMVPSESVRGGNFTRALEATRGCFGMNGAGWRRAGPHSSSSAKRHGREFTKNAKTCKRS